MGKKIFTQIIKKIKYLSFQLPRTIRFNKKIAYSLLLNVSRIFADNKFKYFIDFGTLLGFIRDGEFIEQDMDIDFGLIVEDLSEISRLKNILKSNKFVLKYEYKYQGSTVQLSYVWKKLRFDVNFYFQTNDNSSCYLFYNDEIYHKANEYKVVKME